MYIDRVELEGFKSFARRTMVHLGPGISGVVGPNGCGKSNIVDAIKWCLGEQSAKALRGQHMGDVIFNGSETEKPSDFVEVSLIFNKGKSEFKGMFAGLEEVQVTRKLNRSGQSQYLLNRSKVRLKDVQLFFMDTGLYNQRYALIEQGQIGHIVSAKPNQMRLLFEEAAGISHFNERRVAAEGKLNSTQENLDKVQIVVDGLHRQLNTLKRQAKKAVQYKRTKSVIRQLSLAVAVSKYVEWSKEKDVLVAAEKEVLDKETELEHVNRRQWSMLTQAKQSLSAKQEQSNDFQKRLQTLTKNHTEQQTKLTYQRERVKELETRKQKLDEEVQSVQQELSQLVDGQTELNDAVTVAEGLMKSASQKRSVAIDAHTSATKAIQNTDAEIDQTKSQMDKARRRIASVEGEKVAAAQRLKDIESNDANRASEIARLSQRQGELESERSTIEQELAQASTAVDDARQNTKVQTQRLSEAQASLQEKEKEAAVCRKELQEVKRKRDGTQNLVHSTQRMIDSNQGVSGNSKLILQEQGVVGLLLSMLVVPKQQESLLLTLLGEDADVILLDSSADGKDIFLKSKGRMKFLRLPDNWEEAWSKHGSKWSNLMGPLATVSGPKHALYALSVLLGQYSDVPEYGTRSMSWSLLITVSNGNLVCVRNGVHMVGTPSSIASELLHRRRTLLEEQARLVERNAVVSDKESALETVNQGVGTLRKAVSTIKDDLEKLRFDVRRQQEEQQRLQRSIRSIDAEISDIQRQIDRHRQAVSKSQSERETVLNRTASLVTEHKQLHQQMADWDKDLRFAQEQRHQQRQHAGQCASRRREAENECALLAERLVQTKQRRDSLAQSIALLHRRKSTKSSEVASMIQQHTELLHSNRVLADKVLEFETKRNDLQAQVEESIESMRQFMEYAEKMEERVQDTQRQKDTVTAQRVDVQRHLDAVRSKMTLLKHEVVKEYDVRLAALKDQLDLERQLVFQPLDGVNVVNAQTPEEEEMSRALFVSLEDLETLDTRTEWEKRLGGLLSSIGKFGQINFAAIDEIAPIEEEYESTLAQKQDLENSIQQIADTIAQLNTLCTERFLATVSAVASNFKELYPRLVGGGSSSVKMIDPDDPLNTGISIFAQPPGKKLERLSLLSGGERAMVAIALLFSLFQVKPSPVCLMDEVDAPLDEANGERFNTMLKEMSTRSQFIVITHNKKTMEVVDTVYGVTMPTPGVSQLVSVKFQ